jgi:putative phage-type endonuclease
MNKNEEEKMLAISLDHIDRGEILTSAVDGTPLWELMDGHDTVTYEGHPCQRNLMEQRTEEWKEMRRTHIGSSDCAVIMMDSHPYKTLYQLWRDKVLGDEQPITPAMQRGIDLEPELRDFIEQKHGKKYPAEVQTSSFHPWMMASLDGLSDDGIILEIKTTSSKRLDEMFQEEIILIPEHWTWQIQHQLAVTNLKEAILLVSDSVRSFEARISRDNAMIHELIQKEEYFWKEFVMKMKPPAMGKGDYIERADVVWNDAALRFFLARNESEKADRELEAARASLIEIAAGESTRGGGVVVTKYFAQGTVDYGTIPELDNVDLNKYRKPGAERWRIS